MIVGIRQAKADIFGSREIDRSGPRQTKHGRMGDFARNLSRL
jgi:hypothetical protein